MAFNAKALNLKPIQRGSTGNNVLAWQQFLRLKQFPVGTVDGNFGNASNIATRSFQTQNGLPATGIVDEATYRVAFRQGFLFYVANLSMAQLLETLNFGEAEVEDLQKALNSVLVVKPTPTSAARPALTVDGDFGPTSTRGIAEVYRQLDLKFKPTLVQKLSAKTKQKLAEDFDLAIDILTEFTKRLRQRLSGPEWVKAFPFSASIEDLSFPFRTYVKAFEKALKDAGAIIEITNTFRPPERAYLMHYCIPVANRGLAASNVPPFPGVNINWVHYTDAISVAAADGMAAAYDIAYPAALRSNHTVGRAIDWYISWKDTLKIKDGTGKIVSIGAPRSSVNNQQLWSVGTSYGVIKLAPDEPHWSLDGY
jgi:Putative peptidoglycan binding domain